MCIKLCCKNKMRKNCPSSPPLPTLQICIKNCCSNNFEIRYLAEISKTPEMQAHSGLSLVNTVYKFFCHPNFT